MLTCDEPFLVLYIYGYYSTQLPEARLQPKHWTYNVRARRVKVSTLLYVDKFVGEIDRLDLVWQRLQSSVLHQSHNAAMTEQDQSRYSNLVAFRSLSVSSECSDFLLANVISVCLVNHSHYMYRLWRTRAHQHVLRCRWWINPLVVFGRSRLGISCVCVLTGFRSSLDTVLSTEFNLQTAFSCSWTFFSSFGKSYKYFHFGRNPNWTSLSTIEPRVLYYEQFHYRNSGTNCSYTHCYKKVIYCYIYLFYLCRNITRKHCHIYKRTW